jgi:hypothetical protein
MLPDPREHSLDKLGIGSYSLRSDAQSYIRENYEKLCRMEGLADFVEHPVTLYFEDDADGAKTLDWTLYSVSLILRDYSEVFTPHVEQYMEDKGFYDAALELLMPDMGSGENFSDLADALTFKGVEVNDKVIVDKAKIEIVLEERLVQIWKCDLIEIGNNHYQSYLPYIKMRSLEASSFGNFVFDGLNAQYEAGSLKKPVSTEELERAYLEYVSEKAEEVFTSSAAKDQALTIERSYQFDWETLGNEGVAACPELVDEIRGFLSSYDFFLNALAITLHL